MSLCLDPGCKYSWRLPGLVCVFSCQLWSQDSGRTGEQMRQSILSHCLLVPFYFTCHILILGHFLCVYYYTQIIIGYLPPIFYLFLIWSKGRGLRKHMMPTFQFAGDQLWSLTPGTRVSKVCTDGWFGPSRARVELARISLEFGNLGVCVCVYPEKK